MIRTMEKAILKKQFLIFSFLFDRQLDKILWKIFLLQYCRISMETIEYLDEFLFEFDILYQSYDYISSEQKLKLFPATLKGNTLRWFMSLGGETITTWDKIKQVFLVKYHKYCRTKDKWEDLFKMVQKDDESLEDFVERILYNVQISGHTNIGRDVLNIILLCGII